MAIYKGVEMSLPSISGGGCLGKKRTTPNKVWIHI